MERRDFLKQGALGTAALAATASSALKISGANHRKNFIDRVRSREKPVADIVIGHRSTIVPHLGNISVRTGRKLHWDAAKEEVVDDREASALLSRQARKPWDDILRA